MKTKDSLFDDEVSKAWEKIRAHDKRAQVQREDKAPVSEKTEENKGEDEEKAETKENLEETLIPKEEAFISKIPLKSPSLEMTEAKQNLEQSVGFSSDKKEDEKDEKGYSPRKDYFEKKEDERKYKRFEFADELTVRAPTIFDKTDITAFPLKRKAFNMHELMPTEHEDLMEYTNKKFNEEKIESSFERKSKKYRPFKDQNV